mmetsp:Transcript_15463/g.43281  ORF Transcript_15463/g.43281 Transcript_15463/m.43281 type:complete len:541 (-) Transcript_15463:9-1631(-)
MTNHAQDFSGFYVFQLPVPLAVWGSLAGCVLGPLYAPAAWIAWVRIFMLAYCIIAAGHNWRLYAALGQIYSVVALSKKRSEAARRQPVPELGEGEEQSSDGEQLRPFFSSKTFNHLFIIPNFHEPLELLQSTLEHLSTHPQASGRYLVCLAMEAAEEGHKHKAAQLIDQFRGSFLHMFDTSHVKSTDDLGVAANTSWAMRQSVELLTQSGYDLREIVVTKIDADAEVPKLYIDLLDQGLQAATDPHLLVFASPVLFERNCYDVPDATRVMDFMWSAMSTQNLAGSDGVGFPVSNYSVSLKLLQDIDFLDTNSYAIAEDAHLFLKAFFKTQGRATIHTVMVPFNMFCVKTDEGTWWKDIIARATQAERHFQGVNDMAYALKQTLRQGCLGWRHVLLFFRVAEANVFPGVVPAYFFLACAAMGPMLWWTGRGTPELWTSLFTTAVLGNFLIITQVLLWLTYDQLRRFCRTELYSLPDKPSTFLGHVRDIFWMAINVWIFMYLPHVVACTRSILPCIEKRYIRGDKAASTSTSSLKSKAEAEP